MYAAQHATKVVFRFMHPPVCLNEIRYNPFVAEATFCLRNEIAGISKEVSYPCHVGIHLKDLAEYYQVYTTMPV